MSDELSLVPEENIEKQNPYVPASDVCNGLNTLVPQAMAHESKNWNLSLSTKLGMPVDDYVMAKLKYSDYEEFCQAFAKEQVDAIATSIYNFENTGNGIILADATGVGKGRVVAGLMRYSVVNLGVVPMFFTDKKHLINDIYRDFVDIKWDTAVPLMFKKKVEVAAREYSDNDIIEMINEDIKGDDDDLRVEFDLPEDSEGETIQLKDLFKEEYSDVLDELIDAYRQHLSTEGSVSVVYEKNINYEKQVYMAEQMGRMRVLPFIPNKNPVVQVKDKMGNILYDPKPSEIDKIIKSGNLPPEYKVICAAYSQVRSMFDKQGNMTDKAKFWMKYSNNTVIILDESHNASGSKEGSGKQSNTFLMISKMLQNCRYATYVSATFAKRPESMPIYSVKTSLSELNMPLPSIINAFRMGGLPVQEATAAQLVRIGQLVRREKQITGTTEYFYADPDSENPDISGVARDQIIKLNRVAESFEIVNAFSREVQEHFKKALKIYVPDKDERKNYKFSGKTDRFAFLLFNFFLLGLKTRQTYEHAIKQLSNGKKVVIAIANTMESAFDNMRKDYIENVKYDLGDVMPNDFSLYCAYLLSYTTQFTLRKVSIKDDGSTQEESIKYNFRDHHKIDTETERLISEYVYFRISDSFKANLNKILDSKIGTPLSPIDIIKSSIEQAGFSIDEVTGRGRNLVFSKDDAGEYDFTEGRIEKRKVGKKDEIFARFQENDLDCVILNQSGAVGASLHAIPTFNELGEIVAPVNVIQDIDVKDIKKRVPPSSLKNKSEVKQRYMIITQMELDVNKEVQKLGRIDRTGQVYPPMYGYLISAVPSESRLAAMMERKLRSLSANTSANQSQSEDLYSADDFFSNDAVEPFNETMIDIELPFKAKEGVNSNQQNISIYDFTKQMYFANYKLQKDFYATFSIKLNEHIKKQKSDGTYRGAMQVKDYKAKTIATKPLLIGNNNSYSPFGRHAFIDYSEITVFDQKVRESEIRDNIDLYLNVNDDSGVKSFRTVEEYIKYWRGRTDSYLSMKRKEADAEIAEKNDTIKALNDHIKSLREELKSYDLLNKAVELREKIDAKNSEIASLGAQIQSFVLEGKFDEMNATALKVQQLNKELSELQKEFDSNPKFKEILAEQDRPNVIHREIERAESKIEQINEQVVKVNENYAGWEKNVSLFHQFLTGIGKIHYLTEYQEQLLDPEYNDETGEWVDKYNYIPITEKELIVVYAVNFEGGLTSNFNLGEIKIKYVTVTSGSNTVALSKMFKEFSQAAISKGQKNTVVIEPTEQSYKGNWSAYIRTVDTGRKTEKIFVSGNLLKAFGSVLSYDTTGSVVKYSTEDGKVRIGYELGKESTQRFKQSFIDETNYPIYFDFITENFDRLILGAYKKWIAERTNYRSAQRGVVMQVLGTSDGGLFMNVKFNLDYDYNNDYTYEQLIDEDNIEIQIMSTKSASTDGFLEMLKGANVNVGSSVIYETNNQKGMVSKSTGEPIPMITSPITIDYSYFYPNKNLFCTYSSIITLSMYKSLKFTYRLKFSLSTLRQLLDDMLKKKRVLTGISSSDIVEENKDFYIFEQYADEVAEVTSQGVESPEDALAEIDNLLNSLVSLLS